MIVARTGQALTAYVPAAGQNKDKLPRPSGLPQREIVPS